MTDMQVRLLRQKRIEGKTQQTATAVAGMSERSARKWKCGLLPSETKQERWWRTRPEPFDGVRKEEMEPLLQGEAAGRLRATTIIEWLEEKFPGRFNASPCNDDYRTGERSTGRIRRFTSPRSTHRAARPRSTSPTAAPWASPSEADPTGTCCSSWYLAIRAGATPR